MIHKYPYGNNRAIVITIWPRKLWWVVGPIECGHEALGGLYWGNMNYLWWQNDWPWSKKSHKK